MPISTTFQLYCGSRFYWWRKPDYSKKTIDLPQFTDKLYHTMLHQAHLARTGFELTTLVVIGTDCIGSYKSNYHMITTTTATYPWIKHRWTYPWSNPIGKEDGCIWLWSISQNVLTEAILKSRSWLAGDGGRCTIDWDVPLFDMFMEGTDVVALSSSSNLFSVNFASSWS